MPPVQFGPNVLRSVFSHVLYNVTAHKSKTNRGALIDRGANGGIAGSDAKVIHVHLDQQVDVTGIDNHEITALKIVDVVSKIETNRGPAIARFNRCALHGRGRTIHSAAQLEWYKNMVDDRSFKVGGKQRIRALDGCYVPLDIINGSPHIKMTPPTDAEQDDPDIPHIVMTSGEPWDPTVLDHVVTDDDDWKTYIADKEEPPINPNFDQYGNYLKRTDHLNPPMEQDLEVQEHETQDKPDPYPPFEATRKKSDLVEAYYALLNLNQTLAFDAEIDPNAEEATEPTLEANQKPREQKETPVNYEKYRPYFLQVPIEKVRKTFEATTRYATNVVSSGHITQTMRSPFPALNVHRRNEPVATDTFFADTPAVDCGATMAQFYVGRISQVIDIYPMKSKSEFVNTLEDIIRDRGAMDLLISDYAKEEMSSRVLDLLRAYVIKHWKSEPYYQHQNFGERRWRDLKHHVNWLMNLRNVDPSAWLLCCYYVRDIMNLTAEKSLKWRPPLEVLTGVTQDISIALCFVFWDVVYVQRYETKDYSGQVGSEKQSEVRCWFVGFGHQVGHAMTFKVLTQDTRKILYRSRLRLAAEAENKLRIDPETGKVPTRVYLKSTMEGEQEVILPTIDISAGPIRVEPPDESRPTERPDPPTIFNPRIGMRVRKFFEGYGWFYGAIRRGPTKITRDGIKEDVWRVEYADGDKEDLNLRELAAIAIHEDSSSSARGEIADVEASQVETRSMKKRSATPPDPPTPPPDPPKSSTHPPKSSIPPPETSIPRRKPDPEPTVVETVDDEEQEDDEVFYDAVEMFPQDYSPMQGPPLRDRDEVVYDEPDEEKAPHLRSKRKPGDPNPEQKPYDFEGQSLKTPNPVSINLTPEQMLQRTFLMPPEEDGSRYRARIVEIIRDHKEDIERQRENDPAWTKFKCHIDLKNGETVEEIVRYNDIVEYIEADESWNNYWTFQEIIGHKRVKPGDADYKGSPVNVMLKWNGLEQTWEPLDKKDKTGVYNTDPVTVAIYARENGLLDEPIWKSLPGLKSLAGRQKKLIRAANQAKLHSFRHRPVYQYGFQVPRNHQQAMELDAQNGNTMWRDAEILELQKVMEYDAFENKGIGYDPGKKWKKINVHMVYAVKHDGRHRARLVAGGHLTETPIDSVYSSVVSLKGVRILTFIAELNGLDVWCSDISSAYLESYTEEKVYIVAGPEFGELEGCALLIIKALYGLKSSGKRWHERLSAVLLKMGFVPSKAERDIWMRDKGDHYEYIAVYVDDLLLLSKDAQGILDELTKKCGFKMKGAGSVGTCVLPTIYFLLTHLSCGN